MFLSSWNAMTWAMCDACTLASARSNCVLTEHSLWTGNKQTISRVWDDFNSQFHTKRLAIIIFVLEDTLFLFDSNVPVLVLATSVLETSMPRICSNIILPVLSNACVISCPMINPMEPNISDLQTENKISASASISFNKRLSTECHS